MIERLGEVLFVMFDIAAAVAALLAVLAFMFGGIAALGITDGNAVLAISASGVLVVIAGVIWYTGRACLYVLAGR